MGNSSDLPNGIVREEWKFDGIIMSDWGTTEKMCRICFVYSNKTSKRVERGIKNV